MEHAISGGERIHARHVPLVLTATAIVVLMISLVGWMRRFHLLAGIVLMITLTAGCEETEHKSGPVYATKSSIKNGKVYSLAIVPVYNPAKLYCELVQIAFFRDSLSIF